MNPKILTELERRKIREYLKADGQKDIHIRQVVFQGHRNLRQLKKDLEFLERLLATYDSHIKKQRFGN